MKVAIAGSSGLIGSALITALEAGGHQVTRLVRPSSPGEGIAWDPAAGEIDAAALEGFDAVVNLAGRSIGDRRWTDAYKRTLSPCWKRRDIAADNSSSTLIGSII